LNFSQTFDKESVGAIPVPLLVGDTTPSTLTFEFQDAASGSGPDMIFERFSLPMDEVVELVSKNNKAKKFVIFISFYTDQKESSQSC